MSSLAAIGRKIFGKRLYVGLAIALVGMEVLVPRPWWQAPHIPGQLFGMALIGLGLALRAWGSGCAGSHTRMATIEAPRLVTGGPFAYVRNPIYLGSIVLGVGMSCLIGDPLAYALTTGAFCLLYFGIIPAEEEHLAKTFGPAFARYRGEVPGLIPRFRPWPGSGETPFRWPAARGELRIGALLVVIYLGLQSI